jgi:hypothetical protein
MTRTQLYVIPYSSRLCRGGSMTISGAMTLSGEIAQMLDFPGDVLC